MRRAHVGLKVDDIETAVEFYTRLFGAEPSMVRPDYAKWMLDDPLLNFSIDLHGEGPAGSAHFGIQVTSEEELEQMRARLDGAGLSRTDQNDLVCGYQLQHKSWVASPDGVMWETFFTEGIAEGAGYGSEEMP
jgi:catechol 2,3-dioxygenase-like lactoylglutathione lyase family enzyme